MKSSNFSSIKCVAGVWNLSEKKKTKKRAYSFLVLTKIRFLLLSLQLDGVQGRLEYGFHLGLQQMKKIRLRFRQKKEKLLVLVAARSLNFHQACFHECREEAKCL